MNSKRLIRISYFTMLTVIGAFIKIPLGSVSFTLQTLFVITSGFILEAKDAFFSQIVYLILGIIGLPVFSNGGGFSYALQPSFGYIVAFPLGAFLAGLLKSRLKVLSTLKLFVCGIIALLAVYLVGAIYQVLILIFLTKVSVSAAFLSLAFIGVYYIIDAVLIYLVALIHPRLMDTMRIKSEF